MPRKKLPNRIPEPRSLSLQCEAQLDFTAAEDDGEKLPTFKGTAYTGGTMNAAYSYYPVAVDMSGVKASNESRPVLLGHDPAAIVGHTTEVKVGDKIQMAGVLSGVGPAATEVTGTARNGFPWKLSVGMHVIEREFVGEKDVATFNGRKFKGPLVVVRKAELREISFVPIAADDKTSVRIAAQHKEHNMPTFSDWLEAKGFDPEALTDIQRETLQAQYDVEHKQKPEVPVAAPVLNAAAPANTPDPIVAIREAAAAEQVRIQQITRICAGGHADLCAAAIRDGRDPRDVELEVLRASRQPTRTEDANVPGNVLECAFSRAVGLSRETVEASYNDQTLSAADRLRGFGLQGLLIASARQNGYVGRVDSGAFRSSSDCREILRASFSQALVSNILSNVANKTILEAFNHVESAWSQIAKIGTVSDFKTHTRVRLTGDATYEELSETGEIRHGKLGDETLTISAKTYAKMLALTRNDIINDDLGALAGAQVKLGRGAAMKINNVFWTAFLANSDFFTTARGNLVEGTAYALDAADPVAALAKVEQAFLDQTDPDGDPVSVMPQILLTPTALSAHARELMQSTFITTGGASTKTKQGTSNIYAGRFTPVMSAYLGNSAYTGYSATAWYLLADPNDMPVIEIVFLDGQQAPTVESADVDFNKLGIQMRGFHDFGVALMEYRGGVKATGLVAAS
jgi:hypothetical protein